MSPLDQFIDALLLKNKQLIGWPSQKKRYSMLYLLSLSLIVSLLLVFWTVSNFQTQTLNASQFQGQLELLDNQLNVTNPSAELPLKINDKITLEENGLTYGKIIIPYQQLAAIEGKESLTWEELVDLLTNRQAVIKFILFLYTYLRAIPFVLFNLLISFIFGKLCQQILLRKIETNYQTAYMYTCYAFTAPLFAFTVINLATDSLFSYLWLLYLLISLNLFSLIWLATRDKTSTLLP